MSEFPLLFALFFFTSFALFALFTQELPCLCSQIAVLQQGCCFARKTLLSLFFLLLLCWLLFFINFLKNSQIKMQISFKFV